MRTKNTNIGQQSESTPNLQFLSGSCTQQRIITKPETTYLLFMRLPDNSWSPLVLCDFSFSFLKLRFAFKWQSLLKRFWNMQFIEMFLFSHYRLK